MKKICNQGMKIVGLSFIILLWSAGIISAQYKLSREEYILKYKDIAIEEMLRSGIPASITLAQGLLESDNGNSRLALKSNNHFGIKCHRDWKGKKVRHDDDARNECFRKYRSVEESYRDHSDFLTNSVRYAFLFSLEKTDYKGWAKGLKKAGYATNRQYDNLLIRIIEENHLHQYDLIAVDDFTPEKGDRKARLAGTSNDREILERNRIDYIIVREGDSFEKLKDELRLLDFELYRYNNISRRFKLQPGQILYLQPKRNRAARGNDYHVVEKGESMWDISQMYGVKLHKLYEKNGMTVNMKPKEGEMIYLRKKRNDIPEVEIKRSEFDEIEEGEEIRFEFEGI